MRDDDFESSEHISSGEMDLDKTTAREMLSVVAHMFYTAPKGSDPFLDIAFPDEMGQNCVMRMYLVKHPDIYNTMH